MSISLNRLPLTLPVRAEHGMLSFTYSGRLVPAFSEPDPIVAAFLELFPCGGDGHIDERAYQAFIRLVLSFGVTAVTAGT